MYEWLHKRLRSISGKGSRLMIKGILKIGIGVTLLLSAATAVQAQDALLLTGRTTDVRIAEDNNTVHLTISLDLEIKNQSQSNVILFWHEVEIVGNLISASADPTRPNLLFQGSSWPSISRSSFWTDLQKQLDTATPAATLTRTLKSGESLSF